MAKQPRTQLQAIAAEMVKEAGYTVEFGEYEFVSTAVRVIQPVITKWYEGTGFPPPVKRTIENWLYKDNPPEFPVVLLVNYRNKKFSPISTK